MFSDDCHTLFKKFMETVSVEVLDNGLAPQDAVLALYTGAVSMLAHMGTRDQASQFFMLTFPSLWEVAAEAAGKQKPPPAQDASRLN